MPTVQKDCWERDTIDPREKGSRVRDSREERTIIRRVLAERVSPKLAKGSRLKSSTWGKRLYRGSGGTKSPTWKRANLAWPKGEKQTNRLTRFGAYALIWGGEL